MRKIPSHINQYQKEDFEKFLVENIKADLFEENLPYEVVRYRDPASATINILYQKKTGKLTFSDNVRMDYIDFLKYQEKKKENA